MQIGHNKNYLCIFREISSQTCEALLLYHSLADLSMKFSSHHFKFLVFGSIFLFLGEMLFGSFYNITEAPHKKSTRHT